MAVKVDLRRAARASAGEDPEKERQPVYTVVEDIPFGRHFVLCWRFVWQKK